MTAIANRVLALLLGAAATPASAQTAPRDPVFPIEPATRESQTQNEGLRETGRTAETVAGAVGQRQTSRAGTGTLDVLGRLDTRIANRVQNRIRNRIDRNYDPTANATSPFEVANEQTRATARPR